MLCDIKKVLCFMFPSEVLMDNGNSWDLDGGQKLDHSFRGLAYLVLHCNSIMLSTSSLLSRLCQFRLLVYSSRSSKASARTWLTWVSARLACRISRYWHGCVALYCQS